MLRVQHDEETGLYRATHGDISAWSDCPLKAARNVLRTGLWVSENGWRAYFDRLAEATP